MTYPNDPSKIDREHPATSLYSIGMFTQDDKKSEELRKRLAGIGMSWFNKCKSERIPQERQWYLNLAFYRGNQFVQFKGQGALTPFDLYTPPAPKWRVRITINQVRKVIRKEISRLTAQKPNAYVVPSTTEDADVFAAQAGEQIWESLWRRLHFPKTLRKVVFWQANCGIGYIKTWWNEDKKDPDNPEQPGDIQIESVSPFYIFVPDLMEEDLENQPYLIHAQVRPNSWIKQNYGIDSGDMGLDSVDDKLQEVMGTQRNTGTSKKDSSTILEIWVKPGYIPELPNGGMFILAANQVVMGYDKWPYEHEQYPFAKVDGIPSGIYYPASITEDLIPLQQELNRTRGQLIEAKNKMAKPQLMAEKGAVDPRRITTEPGLLIEYRMGSTPPQPLPMQNLPSYVSEEIDRLYSDISDLSGQHEVSNGSTPPGVTAATAISFLQEQDESLIAPHYSSLEEAIEKVAAQSLVYVKMYWQEERTIKVTGLESGFDVQTFKGASLRSNTDIRIESGSALPTSRAAKQAFLMDLMKMGFITPEKGLEMMEIGGLNRIYEQLQVDKRQAQRENLKMRVITPELMEAHNQEWLNSLDPMIQEKIQDPDSGLKLTPPLIVSVHTYDNHTLHIEEHNRYRKSQAFESADDTVKALFEEHVKQHMEAEAGLLTHPLTGMDPNDPNAAEVGAEEDAQLEMEEEEASTGPAPMPEMSDEQGTQEMM